MRFFSVASKRLCYLHVLFSQYWCNICRTTILESKYLIFKSSKQKNVEKHLRDVGVQSCKMLTQVVWLIPAPLCFCFPLLHWLFSVKVLCPYVYIMNISIYSRCACVYCLSDHDPLLSKLALLCLSAIFRLTLTHTNTNPRRQLLCSHRNSNSGSLSGMVACWSHQLSSLLKLSQALSNSLALVRCSADRRATDPLWRCAAAAASSAAAVSSDSLALIWRVRYTSAHNIHTARSLAASVNVSGIWAGTQITELDKLHQGGETKRKINRS